VHRFRLGGGNIGLFAGCFFHMPVVIGCEKHELHELSCFLPCPENNLRTETPRIRESFQGNIHKTSLYLGGKNDHHFSSKKPGWWFGTFFIFPYIGNVIIPTDSIIFQRGRLNHQPDYY
jgi:hypothetical protein